VLAFTGWQVVVVPLRADILDNDLTLVYMAARIGLEHGWSHLYSLPLQQELFAQLRPHVPFGDGARFISPPVYAWFVLPITVFGPLAAVYAWLAISAAALTGAWWITASRSWPRQAIWLLAAVAWYPVLYAFSLAQPAFVVALLVAVAWWLAEAKRPYLAGLVLGLTVIKPTLTLLLPLVLLFAGRWRIVVSYAAVAGILALASLLAIGGQGLSEYSSLLSQAQQVPNNRYFTLAYLLGPGTLSYLGQAIVVAAALTAAYVNRRSSHARVFALGLVATVLGATYWHLQDFTILILAAWLFLREATPAWQRWWLVVVFVGGELAWPLTPLPILVGVVLWFAALAMPRKDSTVAA
jgi:hypothetical protein